jgi:hypothetical protein
MEAPTYDSQLNQRQYPLLRLEMLIDELDNLLASVKNDFFIKGSTSRDYPTLIKLYMNVLIRTRSTRKNLEDVEPQKGDKPEVIMAKIEKYMGYLADKGIYNLGKDEVIFWKIGNP